jgi:probable rRNA maturation factor
MSKFISVFDEPNFKVRKREIHKLIKWLSEELDFKVFSLFISFVSSEEMIGINKQFLNHDYDTDIVTLDYSNDIKIIDADIFISYPMAQKNADKYKVSVNKEIIRLIIHGILHLTGYDDKTPNEKRKMKKVENKLTEKFSILEVVK